MTFGPGDPMYNHAMEMRAQHQTRKAERKRLEQSRSFGDDLSNLYGSARMLDRAGFDLAAMAGPGGDVVMPLGRDPEGSNTGLVWDVDELQGHAVVFGATRSGKGVSSIIPTLLSYAGSMLVIDPKGENAWATMERRKAMGHRVYVLDPWGEVQRRYGDKASPPVQIETSKFNPLAAIDPQSEDFADDVSAIADALIIPGLGEPHWTDSARELVGGLVALNCEQFPGTAHLGAVRNAVAASSEDLVKHIKAAAALNPEALSTRKLARFTDENDEVASVRAVANTQTSILDSVRLSNSLGSDESPLNLAELGTSPITVYLVLPLDRLQTHGRWLRMIITMAIRAIAKLDEPPETPVYLLLDEAGTIGPLRMVEQAFGLMAGVGIRIGLYLQSLVQLQQDYPRSWETFIGNASIIKALKVTDDTTSNYVSRLLGDTTLKRLSADTMALRQGEKGLFGKAGDPNAATSDDKVERRPLMMPQEVRENIGRDKVLVIVPGYGNYLVRRMPYYSDPLWQGLYRDIPKFAKLKAIKRQKEEEQAKIEAEATMANTPKKKSWFG